MLEKACAAAVPYSSLVRRVTSRSRVLTPIIQMQAEAPSSWDTSDGGYEERSLWMMVLSFGEVMGRAFRDRAMMEVISGCDMA